MDMILGKLNFQIVLLLFSSICGRYTSELPHRNNSDVNLQHMYFQ